MTVILYVASNSGRQSSARAAGHELVGNLVTVEVVFQNALNLPK
jgi:hypothetical protein